MGSFTNTAAKQVMTAVFPTTNTSNVAADIGSTASGFKIYTTNAGASYGILVSSNPAVRHRIDLVNAVGASAGANIGQGLSDANFPTINRGNTISGSVTINGSLTNVTFCNASGSAYTGYTGMMMVTSGATGNHTWSGWTLSEGTGVHWKAVNTGQIGFPASTGGTASACGFVLSAVGSSINRDYPGATAGNTTSTNSTTTILATAPTGDQTVIFAYGDLSSVRVISNGDTPVFTGGAISITLT